jgi:hypothetical protein
MGSPKGIGNIPTSGSIDLKIDPTLKDFDPSKPLSESKPPRKPKPKKVKPRPPEPQLRGGDNQGKGDIKKINVTKHIPKSNGSSSKFPPSRLSMNNRAGSAQPDLDVSQIFMGGTDIGRYTEDQTEVGSLSFFSTVVNLLLFVSLYNF